MSTAEAARLLDLREDQVREFVRVGGRARQGRRYAIGFPDLVVLRAARALLEQGVPLARVRGALAKLSRERPGAPLSGVRLVADGRAVAVWEGEGAWRADTGQGLLPFEQDVAQRVAALRSRPAPDTEALAHFERGLDLEDHDPGAAREAYARALTLDPTLVDARVNLGRLLHEAGSAAEAVALYREALERSPDDPIVHFNLALALEDTKATAEAAEHYRRTLALDPHFADAHYNLANLAEQLGRGAEALRHYRAYQRLTEA